MSKIEQDKTKYDEELKDLKLELEYRIKEAEKEIILRQDNDSDGKHQYFVGVYDTLHVVIIEIEKRQRKQAGRIPFKT